MHKKVMSFIIIISIILTIGTGCSLTKEKQQADVIKPIPVIVKKTEIKSIEKTDRYMGSVAANKDIMILPKVSGMVKDIYINEGDFVKEGQALLKIDDTNLQQSVKQAELAYQGALANLSQTKGSRSSGILRAQTQLEQAQDAFNNAKDNLDKTKDLYQQDAVSKSQLDQANSTYLQASNNLKIAKDSLEKANSEASINAIESQVKQAKINITKARKALSDTLITTPINGQVATIMVQRGEMAGPQSIVLQIVDQSKVLVKLNVTEMSLQELQNGKKVKVYIPSIDKDLIGEITYVAPAVNKQTLAFPVEVEVNNQDKMIKAGMMVEVQVIQSSEKDQMVIPTEAVIGTGNNYYVFIINGDKVAKRKIKVKEMNSGETVISSGLIKNDLVVVKGQYELENGTKVEVVKEEGNAS